MTRSTTAPAAPAPDDAPRGTSHNNSHSKPNNSHNNSHNKPNNSNNTPDNNPHNNPNNNPNNNLNNTPHNPADNTTLFKRLRKLLSGNGADTPAQLEAAITGVAQAHAAAAAAARATRAAHEATVLGLLVNEDEEALAASRREAAAAAAHEAELATALQGLQQRLAQLREAGAAAASRALWRECQARLAARGKAIAELQARADAYAQALEQAAQTSEAVWLALPALPSHRPATYGRDLYTRAALYLYGVTEGKSGGSATSPTSAHVARQRPDLVALDAGARDILLMPLTQGDQQANQGEAA